MIDVTAQGFDIEKVDLNAVSFADIVPSRGLLETEEETTARDTLFRAAARNKLRRESAFKASTERVAINATVKARCDAIHALTPKGAEQLSYAAMRDGTSVERFKEIIAGWQREQVAAADEAAAQSILAAVRAA